MLLEKIKKKDNKMGSFMQQAYINGK